MDRSPLIYIENELPQEHVPASQELPLYMEHVLVSKLAELSALPPIIMASGLHQVVNLLAYACIACIIPSIVQHSNRQ